MRIPFFENLKFFFKFYFLFTLTRPTFPQKSYHITVHAPLRAKQDILRVAASHGADLPETDRMHYSILEEGNENGIFEIDAETGVLRAAQAYEKAGEMSLSIQVDDVGGDKELMGDHTDKTTVLVQILPGNFKKPEFLFPNKINSTLVADEVWTRFWHFWDRNGVFKNLKILIHKYFLVKRRRNREIRKLRLYQSSRTNSCLRPGRGGCWKNAVLFQRRRQSRHRDGTVPN